MALTLEMRRELPASRSEAYAAFTDGLAEWWGPEGFTVPAADFDPEPGRAYRIEMQPPEAESFFLTGEFREVAPADRLAFTFNWEPPDPDDVETLVELSFGDALDLRQGEFKTEARLQLHRDGWTDTFNRLERYLRT